MTKEIPPFEQGPRDSEPGPAHRLGKGKILFRRTRYQKGSLTLETRKKSSAVWVYRWWEKDLHGKPIRRKVQIGDFEQYPSASKAQAAADAQRLTINNQSPRNVLRHINLKILWEHYVREELPLKELSTQDVYTSYVNKWILPRWGSLPLDQVKTVEVERWLRGAMVANGTKAKIKNVMSALFSHAVRWEFCTRNPISSGIPVGKGGVRGPSTGVRVSAKRESSPLVLSPVQMKLALQELDFRDMLLVLLNGALGTRRGELGGLRWIDCDFEHELFHVRHSYYWRHGGHLKATKSEASAKPMPMHPVLKRALLEWHAECYYTRPTDFVFASILKKGTKPVHLGVVLQCKIRPAFEKIGIRGVGWHTFRHSVGTMLAEMGEHQLTIRDYLRHSHLNVTNQYLQATPNSKRLAQEKLVEAILPEGALPRSKMLQ